MGAQRTVFCVAGLVLAAATLSGCDYVKDVPMLGRYVAKNVCHDVLVSGYTPTAAIGYVTNIAPPLKNSWNVQYDATTGQVNVRSRWLPTAGTQVAVPAADSAEHSCRNLYNGVVLQDAATLDVPVLSHEFADAVGQFPALQTLVEQQVNVDVPAQTTALLVVYDGQVVAEAYRDGIGPDSPLKGFSMSKSFANLLAGRLADKGLLDVQQPLALPQWQSDARSAIRWDNVLRMSSGLQWHEAAIGKNNQQGILFYVAPDPSAYAAQQPYAVAPDTAFNYSSGDFMNIATALVDQYEHWFDPGWDLGGPFALEFSPNRRYPLLPEGLSLTTRGWAQMASIYMNEGRLGDAQILSPEWVAYSLTPSVTNYDYGAGIWLNRGQYLYPNLPTDAFAFLGSYDRAVAAIPSRKVVFVRIGYSDQPGDFNMEAFMLQALALLPEA
jgi:CubicO group peptidase (beta-lactamase class C family)